jgi:hypothetical protein
MIILLRDEYDNYSWHRFPFIISLYSVLEFVTDYQSYVDVLHNYNIAVRDVNKIILQKLSQNIKSSSIWRCVGGGVDTVKHSDTCEFVAVKYNNNSLD